VDDEIEEQRETGNADEKLCPNRRTEYMTA